MNTLLKRFATMSALAASLFFWGCENVSEPMQPVLEPAPMVVNSTTGERYVVALELLPSAGSVSAQVGPAGGVLILGRHSLWVSPGAVDASTKFTMARDPEHALRVKLTAGRDAENDIGSQGFNAPVKLGISYLSALHTPLDLDSMKIVYFRPDGLVEPMPSWVQVGNYLVTAEVPHFSVFGLAWGDGG